MTAKGRATRERIVVAAALLIEQRGVARTSIEDVRGKAEVSASQLYHYFDDKDALVRAVVAHQTEATLAMQRPLLDSLDSVSALRAWRDRIVEVQAAKHCVGGCTIGSLASELVESESDAREDLIGSFDRWEELLRDGLRRMHEQGVIDADPERLALTLLATLQGALLLGQMRRSTEPVEIALDTMIEHIEALCG